ncbi:MAG: hypothetical protein CSA15_01500 [Candidatus Delongbacteria bacterium]|nr:MAG: hypothetical protein CSA15_01500 [Candidatus Delongbacteria bacterium]
MRFYLILIFLMVTIVNATITEDFESGDLLSLNWESYGNADWVIDENSNQGIYSAKSGVIYDNQNSDLSIELNYEDAGEVTFSRKVSCEPSGASIYDGLFFYIDDIEIDKWGGEFDWEEFTYPVEAGIHTFKWSYIKDYSTQNGEDCAWIDDITFTNGSILEDNEAPELISVSGVEALINENMIIGIKIREATGLESVKAEVTVNGTTETITMNDVSKSRRFYNFEADLGSYSTPTAGTIKFILEDQLNHINMTDLYNIGWFPYPVVYLTESFEGGEIPNGWNTVQTSGTLGEWTVESEALSPSGTLPQDGEKLIRYSSAFTASGNDIRLELPPIDVSKEDSHLKLSFYLFHSLGNTWANDSLIVQVKDGSDWIDVERFYRFTGDPNEWHLHEVDLDQYGKENSIQIGLLGCSANGRDLNLDKLQIFREFDIVDIDESQLIENYRLYQNYPNPFNPITTLSFKLDKDGEVDLSVYNTKGEIVKTIVNSHLSLGSYSVDFNGLYLNSGIYFYSLSVDGKVVGAKKMVLVK